MNITNARTKQGYSNAEKKPVQAQSILSDEKSMKTETKVTVRPKKEEKMVRLLVRLNNGNNIRYASLCFESFTFISNYAESVAVPKTSLNTLAALKEALSKVLSER